MLQSFHSMHELLHMGGYGYYVWSAYGAMAFLFSLNLFFSWRQARKQRHRLRGRG